MGQYEIGPVDENHSDDGCGPPAGPLKTQDGNRSPQQSPCQRRSPPCNEDNARDRRQRIDDKCRAEIEIEQGKRGSRRATGRAGDPGDVAEGART